MKSETMSETGETSSATSLMTKMLNIFVSPDDVFAEIASQPPRLNTWLVPTLLVCLTAMAFTGPEAHQSVAETVATPSPRARMAMMADACVSVFLGALWSAFVLWLIGRFCLKTRFSIFKSLEITGLAAIILVLDAVITGLLMTISGDHGARPALSLLLNNKNPHPTAYAVLDALNLFQIWTTVVLAIGLSKLSGVSFKECAFWVFGYWLVVRVGLILLA